MNLSIKNIRRRLSATPLRTVVSHWRHRGLQPNDVFLASFPKSGSTWVRHMLVHLFSGKEHDFLGGRDRFIPYVGRHGGQQNLRCPDGGRLIKTHETYRAEYRKVVFVARDVRDVAISNYWHHCRERGEELSFQQFIADFIEGYVDPYGSWQQHVVSWVSSPLWNTKQLLFVRYEDLRSDPVDSVSSICSFLSVDVERDTVRSVVEANSFRSMQKRERENQRMKGINQSSGVPFVRKGAVGQWREVLSDEQQATFAERCGESLSLLGYQIPTGRRKEAVG